MPDFVPLAERIVDAILETDPGLASYAGDHRFDDRLPDLSPGAVADRVTMLRDAADALATARAVLRDVPRMHAETAVGQFAGAAALIRVELPTLLGQEPGLRSAVDPAAAAAVDALDEFGRWLRNVVGSGEPRRDPPPGRP